MSQHVFWPVLIGCAYAIVSAVTFAAFWRDKRAAAAGRWRTPERTLHLMELLGGWPGALAAQRLLRHKSAKRSYRLILAGIIALHVLAWIGIWALQRPA